MTAENDTHRESVNPKGAYGSDVQPPDCYTHAHAKATRRCRLVADGSGLIEDLDISITADEAFKLIANPRRRELIKHLSAFTPLGEESDTHIELKELSTSIVVSRTGRPVSELTQSERHRAYVSLTQVHAVSLDESGIAEYHKRVKKITPTEDIHALATIIEAVESATQRSIPE